MKFIVIVSLGILFSSCSDSFINHSLKAEKTGECSQEAVPVKMISNINGERYEFYYCLPEGFDKKDYSIIRNGDSLLVKFPKATGRQAAFKLTLDIDAKPPYHYITLGEGGQTIYVVASERL